MTNTVFWESEPEIGSGDFARLVRNEESGRFAMVTTDCGRQSVVLLSNEDIGRLVYAMTAYAFDRLDSFIRDNGSDIEDRDRSRSEKDAMWERE